MRKSDLADLMKTVERLRGELHPDLDPDFVKAVIAAEQDNPEDEEAATSAIDHAVAEALAKKGMG